MTEESSVVCIDFTLVVWLNWRYFVACKHLCADTWGFAHLLAIVNNAARILAFNSLGSLLGSRIAQHLLFNPILGSSIHSPYIHIYDSHEMSKHLFRLGDAHSQSQLLVLVKRNERKTRSITKWWSRSFMGERICFHDIQKTFSFSVFFINGQCVLYLLKEWHVIVVLIISYFVWICWPSSGGSTLWGWDVKKEVKTQGQSPWKDCCCVALQ